MNICFLSGKIIKDIELKFIYNSKDKTLGKEHISIAIIFLETEDKQIIKLHCYNERADYAYRKLKMGDYIWIQGRVREKHIEVENCYRKTSNMSNCKLHFLYSYWHKQT